MSDSQSTELTPHQMMVERNFQIFLSGNWGGDELQPKPDQTWKVPNNVEPSEMVVLLLQEEGLMDKMEVRMVRSVCGLSA